MSVSPSVNKRPIPMSVWAIICTTAGIVVFSALGGIAHFMTSKNKRNGAMDIDPIISKNSDPAYRRALTDLACSPKNDNYCLNQDDVARILRLNFSLAASPDMGSNVIKIDPSKQDVVVNVHLDDIKKIGVLHQAFDYIDRMNKAAVPLTRVCFTAGYNGSAGLRLLPGTCPPTTGLSPS